MKLFVTETGDSSAGIFSHTWEISCPFEADEMEKPDLDWFKGQILSAYREFAATKMTAIYDYELAELEKQEAGSHEG